MVVITTDENRTVKALASLERAGQWLKVRDANGRAIAYGIPSATTPGLYHFANSTQCTCPDHARFGNHCWHSRAVAMHVVALRIQPMRSKSERPVLDMVRHDDGEITWESHAHADGSTTYLPRHDLMRDAECGCVLRNNNGACSHLTNPLPPMSDAQAARIFAKL
jgi:hypothetical protein